MVNTVPSVPFPQFPITQPFNPNLQLQPMAGQAQQPQQMPSPPPLPKTSLGTGASGYGGLGSLGGDTSALPGLMKLGSKLGTNTGFTQWLQGLFAPSAGTSGSFLPSGALSTGAPEILSGAGGYGADMNGLLTGGSEFGTLGGAGSAGDAAGLLGGSSEFGTAADAGLSFGDLLGGVGAAAGATEGGIDLGALAAELAPLILAV